MPTCSALKRTNMVTEHSNIIWAILLFIVIGRYSCEDGVQIFPSGDQLRFMQKFGYLDEGGMGEAQYSQNAVETAIRNLQRFGALNVTGVLDAETIKLMGRPRCGVKDIIRRRIKRYVAIVGWQKRIITYFIANWNTRLGRDVVYREIHRAFDVWAPYGKLRFARIDDPSADIVISFSRGHHGDAYPFDGLGGVLAHAFFPREDSIGGDMHFDDEEIWSTNGEEDTTDFFSTAVHELGHALGLAHSPVPTSIMYPYYRGSDSPMNLDYDDVLGMYKLYIANHDIEPFEDTPNEPIKTTTQLIVESTEATTSKRYGYTFTYTGDDESVDEHKKHDDKHGIPDQEPEDVLCSGDYDSITVFRQELFVFKGNKIWRLKRRKYINKEYPVTILQMFGGEAQEMTKIDAAYERLDGNMVIFTGDRYWVHDGNHFLESARPLRDYGVLDSITSIDAVQLWPKNEKTYLFKDDFFWRFDERTNTLDPGYPKNISRWHGIPAGINGALTWEGFTYFFKKLTFWRFDNVMIKASDNYPLPVVQYWFGCPETDDMFQLVESLQKQTVSEN